MNKPCHVFTWSSILNMALKHKRNFIFANVISILATLIYLPVPLIIPSLINEVILKQPGFFTKVLSQFLPINLVTPALIMITAFLFVLLLRIIEEILRIVQGREFKVISKDIVYHIRTRLLLQLDNISTKEYETLGSGKLASYYIKDLDTLDEFIGVTVSQAAMAIMFLCGIAVVLFIINWKIALFIFLFNPFSLLLTATFAKKLKELKAKQHKAFEIFQDAFIETVDAIAQIRADNNSSLFISRLIKKAKQIRDDSIAYEWKTEIVSDFGGIFLFMGVDIYYLLCMTLILINQLTIGMMVALLQYVFQVQHYMNVLIGMQSAFYAADAALSRINAAMNLEKEPKYIEKTNPFINNAPVTIDIKNLHFSYTHKKPILTNINMLIEPNKTIAIVGPSGAGKSSWIQALLGFYPIDKGDIKINNASIYDVGFALVRKNIYTVLQSPIIFNDTIRNNLTLENNFSETDLWQALHKAQLKQAVEHFDHKLDTHIGKKGIRLSGGQRQRLAIARMLLRNSKVVILDEATSALDFKTEYELFEAIKDFLSERTAIIITHRLSTIMNVDKIYVINNGCIEEEGTHNELINMKGIYYSLYILQKTKDKQ